MSGPERIWAIPDTSNVPDEWKMGWYHGHPDCGRIEYLRADIAAANEARARAEGLRAAAEVARQFAKAETGPLMMRRMGGMGVSVAGSARRRISIRIASAISNLIERDKP